jgi:hypothetical protein
LTAFVLLSLLAQGPLIQPVDRAAEIQRNLKVGELLPNATALTPCEPDRTPAFSTSRGAAGVWAGRFRVTAPGTGVWKVRVDPGGGSPPLEMEIGGDAPGAQTEWLAGPVSGTLIKITLTGPGSVTARCPVIRLEAELRQRRPGAPRGLVGADDRWAESSAKLAAAPDVASLRKWSSSLAHIELVAPSGVLVPCTGFFISAHVMMTAAHCIGSRADAARAVLRIGTQEIPGSSLRLIMALKVDFALVWVNDPPAIETLALEDASAADLVVWQWPELPARLVSADGCVFERFDGDLIRHRCDTTGGASGAPVQMRSNGAVVGLHVLGCAESGTPQCANFALRAREIRSRILGLANELRSAEPQAAAEILAVIR